VVQQSKHQKVDKHSHFSFVKKKKNHINAERKKIKEGTSIYLQKASYYCNASISKVENSAVFGWAEKKMSPSDETKKKNLLSTTRSVLFNCLLVQSSVSSNWIKTSQ